MKLILNLEICFVLKSLIMKRSTEAVRNTKNGKSIKTHTNKRQFYQSHGNVTEIKAMYSASKRYLPPNNSLSAVLQHQI